MHMHIVSGHVVITIADLVDARALPTCIRVSYSLSLAYANISASYIALGHPRRPIMGSIKSDGRRWRPVSTPCPNLDNASSAEGSWQCSELLFIQV